MVCCWFVGLVFICGDCWFWAGLVFLFSDLGLVDLVRLLVRVWIGLLCYVLGWVYCFVVLYLCGLWLGVWCFCFWFGFCG